MRYESRWKDWLDQYLMRTAQYWGDELEYDLAMILWFPPAGRIARSEHIPVGDGYIIPGYLFEDRLSRIVANPNQEVDDYWYEEMEQRGLG